MSVNLNVLILGSGGREHTLAWKIVQSEKLSKLFIAPGNAGTMDLGTNINIKPTDFDSIKQAVIENNVDMVVVGPENPLVQGIHDYFLNDKQLKSVSVIGPQKAGAMLEGSKEFAKIFMQKYQIPTAAYKSVTEDSLKEGIDFLKTLSPPYVLKADGLAAGKGVLILKTLDEAENELKEMLNGKFGQASKKVVIEKFLQGIEISVIVLTDGKSYKILPEAKDYKKIGEQDTGLNTGGMGAISPVPFADKEFMQKVEEKIIKPTIKGLQKENIPYRGFLYFGLINVYPVKSPVRQLTDETAKQFNRVNNNPFVIEYNVRMGDPEAEVVIPRIKSDILDLFDGIANKNLDTKNIEIDERVVSTIMLVSQGYPLAYEKGKHLKNIEKVRESIVFHAGTKTQDNKILTNGGRVIAVSSYGRNITDSLLKSYNSAEIIDFDGKYYRKDIGFDL